MQPINSDRQCSFLCLALLDQLDPRNHILGLGKVIPWQVFGNDIRTLNAASGRPGKPVWLMVGLLILTQIEDLSDECVVEAWVQNQYFQAFFGQQRFTWNLPCDPSKLTSFRRRIGEDGVRKIFEFSVALHGDMAKKAEIFVGSTVQKKNIIFPTDAKLLAKIVTRCHIMVKLEDVKLRRSYHTKSTCCCGPSDSNQKVAGRPNRSGPPDVCGSSPTFQKRWPSLSRHWIFTAPCTAPAAIRHRQDLQPPRSRSALHLQKQGPPEIRFRTMASVIEAKASGISVGAMSFQDDPLDWHTRPAILSQVESIVGQRPTMAICDRGYRGKRKIGASSTEIPESGKRMQTASVKRQVRERFRSGLSFSSPKR